MWNKNFLITMQNKDYKLRSEYVFYSYKAWNNAKDAVYNYSRSAYDKISWVEGTENYYARLYDDLEPEEAEDAATLIREQGGHYVENAKENAANGICPVCGTKLQPNELFCPICGMRVIFKSQAKGSVNKPQETQHQAPNLKQTFSNFTEWSQHWAELYVQNYAYWTYLLYGEDRIVDDDFSLSLITCAYKFSSFAQMHKAYDYIRENGKDRGFGLPHESILLAEEENAWLVLLDCCDLPFVLLVAEYFDGKLQGWCGAWIPCPPLPISIEKSVNLKGKSGIYTPIKIAKNIDRLKPFVKTFFTKKCIRSIYVFIAEQDYNNAQNAIRYGNYDIYNKLEWYGKSSAYGYDNTWVVKLYDDLNQEEVEWAVGRIREQNGQYYQS